MMDTLLTVIQAVLGLLLTVGAVAKLILPYAKYTGLVPWSEDFKPEHIRLIGVLELSGSVGLLVPLLVPSLAMLAPLAAAGIALYMAGAIATHLRRSEYLHMAGISMFFLVPALLVAYGKLMEFAV